jgi:putative ABC transport system permease protein
MTESAVLGVTAGILATAANALLVGPLNRWIGDGLPDPRGLAIDGRVAAFAAAAAILATVVFGLAAVVSATGHTASLFVALREGGRGLTGNRSPLRRAIVAAQLAVGAIALVGAGLLARSYSHLREVAPGFDPSQVLTARVTLPDAVYPRGARQVVFFRQVLSAIAGHGDVAAAGAVSILPESSNFDQTNMRVTGRTYAPGTEPTPDVYRVTPGYFPAMRIGLLAGRLFTDDDDDRHLPVAIINQAAAQALFPGMSAVGRQVFTGAGNEDRMVVGVVGDVYQYGLDHARTMQLYVPHADNSGGDLTLVIRGKRGVAGLPAIVRNALQATDPGVPADNMLTMDDVLSASATPRRVLAAVSLVFALGTITLALIGLYGVIAYSVAQRTPEIGVRMTLGATAGAVIRDVLGDVTRLVGAGVGIGLVLALWLAQLMAPLLFSVTPRDAVTFIGAPLALLALAALAAALPARRAALVDPVIALRQD